MTYRQHVAQQDRRHREHQRMLELRDPMGAAGLSPERMAKQFLHPRQPAQPEIKQVAADTYQRGSAFGPAKPLRTVR